MRYILGYHYNNKVLSESTVDTIVNKKTLEESFAIYNKKPLYLGYIEIEWLWKINILFS